MWFLMQYDTEAKHVNKRETSGVWSSTYGVSDMKKILHQMEKQSHRGTGGGEYEIQHLQ